MYIRQGSLNNRLGSFEGAPFKGALSGEDNTKKNTSQAAAGSKITTAPSGTFLSPNAAAGAKPPPSPGGTKTTPSSNPATGAKAAAAAALMPGGSSGPSAADVMGFVSALLPAVTNVGMSFYAQSEAAKAQKRADKLELQQMAMAAQAAPQQVVVQSGGSSGLMIGAIVGGVALVGLIVILLTRKSGSGEASYSAPGAAPGPGWSQPTVAAAPAPRIKRIKRISRPRKRKQKKY